MPEEKQNANTTPDKNTAPETEGQESGAAGEGGGGGNLTGPEGILMLCAAGLLDGIGLMLFLLSWLGIDDYGILDILGMIIIGGWMLFRSGELNKNVVKRGLRRFILASAVEIVPFLGGIAPSWTILVWKELK